MPLKSRSRFRVPLTALAWLAVAAAAFEFVFRVFLRVDLFRLSDFAYPYVSARLWLSGGDPYDRFLFYPTWLAAGAVRYGLANYIGTPVSVYPPVALLPVLPLALLRWRDAVHLYLACGIVLYGIAILGLLRLGWPDLRWSERAQEPRAVFFLAIALGFAPMQSAFISQNFVLYAACAAVLSLVCLLRVKEVNPVLFSWLAGSAITLSICFKPTTGVFLLPWIIYERRWRLLIGIFIAGLGLAAIACAPLFLHHGTVWLTNYRANVYDLFHHGGNADVSHQNPFNTERIDLQLIFFAVCGDRSIALALAALVYCVLMVVFMRRAGGVAGSGSNLGDQANHMRLLVASACLAFGMLPVYSRMYAGGILLPLVLWCLLHLRLSAARWLLLLLGDFLGSSSTLVSRLFGNSAFATGHPRLWDATIGGHTSWLMLAIGIVLVWAMHQAMQQQSQQLAQVPA